MRFLLAILLTALLAFVAGLYAEWWIIAIAAFFVALLLPQTPGAAFLSGFLGLFILWGILAIWSNAENNGLLAEKIAKILPLGGSTILLILLTALIGGLVSGLAAMTGSYLRTTAHR